MVHNGIPIDTDTLYDLKTNWEVIKQQLVTCTEHFGVYDGTSFRHDRFERLIARLGIPWPQLESGKLDTKQETFREMALCYPALKPIKELRHTLSGLKLNDLHVGSDGRNRTSLYPFHSKTSRNQPSSSKFIFGPSRWLRSLIKPQPGRGLAYLDYSQQEIGIAAALSKDERLMSAYATGDCYLAFAVQAGAAPPDATKVSHGKVRGRVSG